MLRSSASVLAAIAVLTSSAAAQGGLDLRWDACGPAGGSPTKVIDCSDPDAVDVLVATVRPDVSMSNLVTFEAWIDITSPNGELPGFWVSSSCALNSGDNVGAASCPTAGVGSPSVSMVVESSSRALMYVFGIGSAPRSFVAGSEYTLFRLFVYHDKGCEPGCAEAIRFVLSEVHVEPLTGPPLVFTTHLRADAAVAVGDGGATGVVPPQFLSTWGTLGSGAGEFDQPEALALDGQGTLFVADHATDRIQRFTENGTYILEWGSPGSGAGQFHGPSGVAVDAAGMVYVTDYLNHRVQKFTGLGVPVTSWGSPGSGDGQFDRPDAVAVAPSGTVYVADSYNHRIQRFTSTGSFLGKWGTLGNGDGQMHNPAGVAVDARGDVYVSDANNHRIQKFDADGTFLKSWGTFGAGPGQFNTPQGIATDITDNLFVSDYFNNRIQAFNFDGQFVTQWGTLGTGNGQFDSPADVAVDGLFRIFVADLGNHRVQKFGRGSNTSRDPYVPGTFAFAISPNPARTARVSFDLPKAADVELSVFDLQGRQVAALFAGPLPAGRHARQWAGTTSSGSSAEPGVYFYRIRAGDIVRTVRGVRIR